MDSATIDATCNGRTETIDLEDMSLRELADKLRELFPPEGDDEQDDDDPDDLPAHVTLTNPQGFAVHLFERPRGTEGTGPFEPIAAFDDVLEAWSNERDDDRRQAMADYLDNGNDDLDGFEDAYEGQYDSGADFAEQLADSLGAVSEENARWICIDWEATWERNLRHDYWISDSGHVFRS